MASGNGDAAQRRREHWREVLRRWESSGLSQAAFCRQRKIPIWKFTWWKKRVGRELTAERRSEERPAAGELFVPIHVAPPGAASAEFELTLRGGRLLRFHADVPPARLAAIVTALEACPASPRTESSSC